MAYIVGFSFIVAYAILVAWGSNPVVPYVAVPILIGLALLELYLATANMFDFKVVPPKSYISEEIYGGVMLLPNENVLPWKEQCEAAEEIDKDAFQALSQLVPAETFEKQEAVALVLEVLRAEQIEGSLDRQIRLDQLPYLSADIIKANENLPERFRPKEEKETLQIIDLSEFNEPQETVTEVTSDSEEVTTDSKED